MLDRYESWGWTCFLVCAVIFLAMGIRDRDVLLIAGSTLFLIGCVLFLRMRPRR